MLYDRFEKLGDNLFALQLTRTAERNNHWDHRAAIMNPEVLSSAQLKRKISALLEGFKND